MQPGSKPRVLQSPSKNNNKKIHHAHLAEDEDEEERPPNRLTKEDVEAYVLFYALYGSVTPREDTSNNDSGASKHMTRKKKTLSILEEKKSPQKVSLGDDYQYPIKGIFDSR